MFKSKTVALINIYRVKNHAETELSTEHTMIKLTLFGKLFGIHETFYEYLTGHKKKENLKFVWRPT